MNQPSDPGVGSAGPWLWLFPATYAVHIAGEGLAGERFYHWIHRVVGRELDGRRFWALNGVFGAAMMAAVLRARTDPRSGWLVPVLGTITTLNGVGHAAGSAVTQSYSPGVVSGITLWTPLGLFALVRSRQSLPRGTWWIGVGVGAAVNGCVGLLALVLSKPSGVGVSAH
jgi:Protein of unknown function with HXXEE motif